jgi:hypothetical protein
MLKKHIPRIKFLGSRSKLIVKKPEIISTPLKTVARKKIEGKQQNYTSVTLLSHEELPPRFRRKVESTFEGEIINLGGAGHKI